MARWRVHHSNRASRSNSFVVGGANRLAHAAARQIAETVLVEPQRFNPLYIHSSVGLGKTHLLHAIAWEVRRRHPAARVLYYTAERFRYRFVEAVQSKDALSFKELVRSTDILLIDDMEFLHGEKTSQEFDHTLNALLDGGKQVVVASARAPSQLDKLDQRMRSRLGGGMVAEVGTFDEQLRYDILCRRVEERRQKNPTFVIADEVLRFLAGRLTESGRELDGAVTRLFADNQFTKMAVTLESAEVDRSRSVARCRAAADQDRGHSAGRFEALWRQPQRNPVGAAAPGDRAAAADRHVAGQDDDGTQSAGNRSPLWRTRSYDGPSCYPQDRGRACGR